MARLIETTVWVDFTRSRSPLALKAMILPWIMDADATLCEPVIFEVLRHARTDEWPRLQAQFATVPLLPVPPDLWDAAARLGRQCREAGFTAGSLDLLIAATALHHRAEIVTFDADYTDIARASPLRVRLLTRPG